MSFKKYYIPPFSLLRISETKDEQLQTRTIRFDNAMQFNSEVKGKGGEVEMLKG